MMIVVLDEAFNADVETARQKVVFQQDPVLQSLVPTLNLSLRLGMIWGATHMNYAFCIEPIS